MLMFRGVCGDRQYDSVAGNDTAEGHLEDQIFH